MKLKLVLIYTVIMIFNSIFNISPVELILTIPQFILVIFFMFKDIDKAVFLHIIFLLTSNDYWVLDSTGTGYLDVFPYTYAKLKLVSNISFSSLLTLVMIAYILITNGTRILSNVWHSKILFAKFYRLLIYFLISGIIVGAFGFIFSNYKMHGVTVYGSYMIFTVSVVTLLACRYNSYLVEKFYNNTLSLLLSAVLSGAILRFFEIQNSGGQVLTFFSSLLIPALLYYKKTALIPILIGIILSIYNTLNGGASGKAIYAIVMMVIATVYLCRTRIVRTMKPVLSKVIFLVAIISIMLIPSIILVIQKNYSGSEKITSKIWQVTTLQDYLTGKGKMEDVAHSPYVRVAEFRNVGYEALRNPIFFVFGHGYGGYFKDDLHLFNNVSLGFGDYSFETIQSGEFPTAHDTASSMPLLHGFVGLFLFLRLAFLYLKSSKYNYLRLTAIIYFVLCFYFNTLISFCGVFLLFASEYKPKIS